jgi:hypothetical protein
MSREGSPTLAPPVHWLFKSTPRGVACLGIEVYPDGDYWVYDSPTGTYTAGHADKGKWHAVYDQYVADGYVPEAAAKLAGWVPQSWSRQPPRPPWAWARHLARARLAAILVTIIAAIIAMLVWR